MADNDVFLDNIEGNDEMIEKEIDIESFELMEKEADKKAQKNQIARKRIDELMEKRRLKELLDDEEDW